MRSWKLTAALATAAAAVLFLSLRIPGPPAQTAPGHVVDTGTDEMGPPKDAPPSPEPAGAAVLSVWVDQKAELNCPGVLRSRFENDARVVIDARDLPTTCVLKVRDEQHGFQVFGTGELGCDTTLGELRCDRKHVGP